MPVSPQMSVLVVDDVPLMVTVVRAALGRVGFGQIDEAADGETALARVRACRYDLVIADYNMSPMSGLDLLRRVRADAPMRETPFILMTTKEHTDRLIRARQAGANGCLVKPFTLAALGELIETVCRTERPARTLIG